jgi:hypothetical protein
VFCMVYVSSAVNPFSKDELLKLLEKSRKYNTKLEVTGMLLYKDGNFLQVLEGEQQTVQTLYTKIAQDPRHKGCLSILQGPTEKRDFPDWSMGFRDLRSPEVSGTPVYNDFMNVPLTGAEFSAEPTRLRKLLLLFKQKM